MLTPRGLAEFLLGEARKAVAEGRGGEDAGVSMLDARALCLGIKWLAEGTYAWISDREREAGRAMADRLRDAAAPDGRTPEQEALDLLDRFERMCTTADAGLTFDRVVVLCTALEQLAAGNYPHPLSDSAQAERGASTAYFPAP